MRLEYSSGSEGVGGGSSCQVGSAVDLDQTGSNEYGGWVVGPVAKFSAAVVL